MSQNLKNGAMMNLKQLANIALPNTLSKMTGHYDCPELRTHPTRPGCMDAYKLPSRINDVLIYPKTKDLHE
mgnify:CR=1 FL=1